MGILGSGSPKIKLADDTEIILKHSIVENEDYSYRRITHEDEISHVRYNFTKGKHLVIELIIHLWKYLEQDAINPIAKFKELNALEGINVKYAPHEDALYYKDELGNEVEFHVEEVYRFYLEKFTEKDMVYMKLHSNKFIDLSTIPSENGEIITDDLGELVIDDNQEIITADI